MDKRAERVELTAHKRTVLGKQVRQLRRQGWVPGVMYGHGFDPMPLQFEVRELKHTFAQISGSQLINIKIEGQDQPEMALVRDVQVEPISRLVSHVDFYRVTMTERIRTEVHLSLVGQSPAVQRNEGILLQGISAIEVECLPGDLVDAIDINLSNLTAVDQGMFVRDLVLPAGIEVLTDKSEMIVRVVPLEMKAEAEEAVAAAPVAEVEVITEAKAKEREVEQVEGEE